MSYRVLACKDGNWQRLSFSSQKKKERWSKPKIRTKQFDSIQADKMLDSLTKLSFWTMSQDSLNIYTKELPDGATLYYTISDAVSYQFEFFSADRFSIVYAYAPEHYLEKLPEITIRRRFLQCLSIFNNAYHLK